jgi:hypothetical protein
VSLSDSPDVFVHSGAEISQCRSLFDCVVLRQPLEQEFPWVHVDSLGLGNQIEVWIAAKCWAPGTKIVGFHRVSVVSPHSLSSRGRRLDFVRRSSFSMKGRGIITSWMPSRPSCDVRMAGMKRLPSFLMILSEFRPALVRAT